MGEKIAYGSVCSGMEMAAQALEPIGYECQFVAEIEAFPCGIMGHRIGATAPRHPLDPSTIEKEKDRKEWENNNRELERMAKRQAFGNRVVNEGDFTKINPTDYRNVEVLIGGPPCQAFSVAGARRGLKDHRGNLTLAYVGLVHELADDGSLRVAVYENVPGLLSDKDNAFGCFLGALVGHDAPIVSPHGKGRWTDFGMAVGPRARAAWRIFNAQHFGLAQRRRRLFVVVCFGDGADPARILLEPEGVPGIVEACLRAPEDAAEPASPSPTMGGAPGGRRNPGRDGRQAFGGNNTSGPIDLATAQTAQTAHGGPHGRLDFASETFVVEPVEVAPTVVGGGRKGGGYSLDDVPLTPVAFQVIGHSEYAEHAEHAEHAGPIRAKGGDFGGGSETIIAFNSREELVSSTKVFGALGASHPQAQAVAYVPELANTLKASGFDASEDGTGRQPALVATCEPLPFDTTQITSAANRSNPKPGDPCHPVVAAGHPPAIAFAIRTNQTGANGANFAEEVAYPVLADESPQAVAFSIRGREGEAQIEPEAGELAPALRTGNGGSSKSFVATVGGLVRWAVRRLMPTECEVLQGSARDYTRIPWRGKPADQCPDGPRYKALGNSFPRPVITWLGLKIKAELARVDALRLVA